MSIRRESVYFVLKKEDNVFTKNLACGIPKSVMSKALLACV